ncbi:MAG TPA: OsmC family protein [Burkholderiaceae bacterium]|nr:OsmC family protein [Burkholderiaceae bacterium]
MKEIVSAVVESSAVDYRHDIETSGHRLVCDEPPRNGGTGSGPGPYELVLSGLGGCTAITLRMYAKRKGWDLGHLRVELHLLMDREGRTEITRALSSSAALSDEQWERLLFIAEKTPVTLTLKAGADIRTHRA